MLIPPKNLLLMLVARATVFTLDCGEITTFMGYPSLTPSFEENLLTHQHVAKNYSLCGSPVRKVKM